MKKLLLSATFVLASFNSFALSKLSIADETTTIASYDVSIAQTNQERAKGLMFVRQMDENKGMLFIWDKADKRAMWMKNTYIPLDMLFINNNKVIGIVENAEPHTLSIRTVDAVANKVLELNAGQVEKHNIQVGNTIILD